MSDRPTRDHDPLRDALRRLPRVHASEGFTRGVLNRARTVERRSPLRAPRRWPRLATAVATLTALVIGAFVISDQLERRAYERRRAALQQQHDELRRELAEIRQRATRPARLYVDSAPDVDLVVDLDGWMTPVRAVQPAAYQTQH